jgi:nicotinate-nucleotide adenylyltransferase
MRIAVLGGSFDPPHLGHILIARQVLEFVKVDEVWAMPVSSHAFDKKVSLSDHRLKMTNLIEEDKVIATDFEIKLGGISKTIVTLRSLQKLHPEDSFTFIIGSDQLYDFKKWDNWEDIIREFGLIIFPREIVQTKLKELVYATLGFEELPENIKLLDSPDLILTNISSSKIRKRVKNNLPIDYMVPKDVEKYIKDNKLYV